jgi:sporadic carbohydrate cluster 2OG-Fe(II) oxygenase
MACPPDTAGRADLAPLSFFRDQEEEQLIARFLEQGYVILPAENLASLHRIRDRAAALMASELGLPEPLDGASLLDQTHRYVKPEALNDLRLSVFRGLNNEPWLRFAYFDLARNAIGSLVGNELAMQRRINLSIQLPEDESSLLPVHADVWSGDSPFELVLWVPLVDCYRTKTMFIAPFEIDRRIQEGLARFDGRGIEDLYRELEPDLIFLDVPFGQVLLFTQNIMHGNRVNKEKDTRWSMNCRFKSALSPYADKKLGEFFEPITLRPATRLGMRYALPGGFDE